MSHTNYASGANAASYIIKCRDREQREIQIAGGMHRMGGRRRITSWGKWKPVRYGLATEEAARADVAERDKRSPLTEFAIFYKGKRLPNNRH